MGYNCSRVWFNDGLYNKKNLVINHKTNLGNFYVFHYFAANFRAIILEIYQNHKQATSFQKQVSFLFIAIRKSIVL